MCAAARGVSSLRLICARRSGSRGAQPIMAEITAWRNRPAPPPGAPSWVQQGWEWLRVPHAQRSEGGFGGESARL